MKNITWEEWTDNKFLFGITIAILVFAAIVFVLSMVVLAVYIKTSWIERNNSQDITGGELSRKILDEEGMKDVEIKPSIFYIKYWNHSKFRKTFRLRPWTVNRKSIWTMTEAAQQTVVSTWRRKKGRMGVAFSIFRIPTIINIVSVFLSIFAIAYMITKFKSGGSMDLNSSEGKRAITIIVVTFGIIALLISWSDVLKLSIIRKHVTPILLKQGFNEKEMRAFKLIYTSRLVLSIAVAIYNTLRVILQIVATTSKETSN